MNDKKPPYLKWILWAVIGVIALVLLMMSLGQ